MESIYKLNGRAAEAAARYDEIRFKFECLMEENGGELNEESQELIDELEELEAIKRQIDEDILEFPDEYAAWYKNVEARKKVHEAERAAFIEMQKQALAKYDAKVKKDERDLKWIQENIAGAMDRAKVTSFDKKSRPNALFSLWFQESKSIEVDEELALKDYKKEIDAFNAKYPEWLSIEPKIVKKALTKTDVLPTGFERKISKSLRIQ